jgi:hypothetical protein
VALLTFPAAPSNGEIYPATPSPGQYQYEWSAAESTWRLLGAASGVSPGVYGSSLLVPQITVDSQGQITVATNVAIQIGDTTQIGLVQLVDDTLSNDSTKALTAAQGYYLQSQIGDVTLLNPAATDLVTAINNVYAPIGVTPGTYGDALTVGRFTVDSNGRITTASDVAIQTATTTQPGVTQLVDNLVTNDGTKALTAAQGYTLQQQIDALALVVNLTFAGTVSAATGDMLYVTAEGTLQGFSVGSPLPSPALANTDFFAIVTSTGTMTPPGGSATFCNNGDWWISDGAAWNHIAIGQPPAAATYKQFDDISASFDGLTLSFPLSIASVATTPSPLYNIQVFVGGVVQIPTASYSVAGSTITFVEAPAPGATFYATTVTAV